MKLRFLIGAGLLAAASVLFAYRGHVIAWVEAQRARQRLPKAQSVVQSAKNSTSPNAELLSGNTLPAEFNLAVPFTSQAPFANWDHAHEEACEEASLMMVDAFYDGRMFTPQSAEDEIHDLEAWETERLGYFEDTTAEELAQVARERYGYKNARVVYEPTIDMIKREVAQGHPVILPAAGRLLGNRYFRQPGPLYHMLVVRGWTKDGMIITNDPGTKRGEGYLYKPGVLMNAVHDWNGGDVENGRKVMIVILPN